MLKRLYIWLFRACEHEWETKAVHELEKPGGWLGTRIEMSCKKCGDWEKRDLI